jgi:hypothetical protein
MAAAVALRGDYDAATLRGLIPACRGIATAAAVIRTAASLGSPPRRGDSGGSYGINAFSWPFSWGSARAYQRQPRRIRCNRCGARYSRVGLQTPPRMTPYKG